MKEITRIHIAKVAYDAEIEAKKELDAYLRTLEAYSDDAEIIGDIEIRITEILAERGVHKNGVITTTDIHALKQQLGEPSDFMGDGDIAIGQNDGKQIGNSSKKLYRDVDNAVAGGVMSGIGAFFGINPLWVRLLFIILAFASFGTALLVYVVLWVVVPPAKTAADKLQMAGRPVTIASIRELNENEVTRSQRIANGRRILTIIVGIGSIFGAIGSMLLVAGVCIRVLMNSVPGNIWDGAEAGYLKAAFVLVVTSGLLLATLFVLSAYASFTQKINKRTLVSAIIVVVVGLASFGTAIGLAQYGVTLRRQAIEANTHEVNLALPAATNTATSLAVAAPGFNVQYIVDEAQPHARMRIMTDQNAKMPHVTAKLVGQVLTIQSDNKSASDICYWPICSDRDQQITIYGPALQFVTVNEHSSADYQAAHQSTLNVKAVNNTNVRINSGTIDTLSISTDGDADISAADATVLHAKLDMRSNSSVDLGTVQALDVVHPNSCPAGNQLRISVWDATQVTINGETRPVKAATLTCMTLLVTGKTPLPGVPRNND